MSEVFPSERLGPASVRFFPRILTIIILACGKIISRGAKRILGGAKIILASFLSKNLTEAGSRMTSQMFGPKPIHSKSEKVCGIAFSVFAG